MLQNARVTAFIVSELLRENQRGGGWGGIIPATQIRVTFYSVLFPLYSLLEGLIVKLNF